MKHLDLDVSVRSNVIEVESSPEHMATSGSECTPPPPRRAPSPRSPLAISCDAVDCDAIVANMLAAVPALEHVVFRMRWYGGDVTLDVRRPMDGQSAVIS